MSFRSLIRYVFLARACDWPACRQYMIKQGAATKDVAYVLACLLRILGSQNEQAKENKKLLTGLTF